MKSGKLKILSLFGELFADGKNASFLLEDHLLPCF